MSICKNTFVLQNCVNLHSFFFDVKLITLYYTKTETLHLGIPDFQYSLVFPQPKHFGLTHLLQTALTC